MSAAGPASLRVVSLDGVSPDSVPDPPTLDVTGAPLRGASWWDDDASASLRDALAEAAAGDDGHFAVDGAVVTVRPVTGAGGDVVAAVVERHGAPGDATAHATFAAVFENAFDAMVLADDEGAYVDANPAACELFGLEKADLLGRSIDEFAPPDFDFASAWAEFAASDRERGTFPLVRADGERRVVEYAATRDVAPGLHLSVLRDVTEAERRREALQAHRDRLARLNRLNAILRDVHAALVEAPTRAAIEQAVCDGFAAHDSIPFAWVGVPAADESGLVPRAWSEGEQTYLDAALGRGETVGPAERAARTGEVSIVDDLATDDRVAAWREVALERGFRSAVAIPLQHGDESYGVLVAYAAERDFWGAVDEDLLAELGRTVGYAVATRQRERAFLADRATHLSLDVANRQTLFGRLAAGTDSSVALERFAPQPDGTVLVTARLSEADPDDLRERVRGSVAVVDATVEPDPDGGATVELNVDDPPFVDCLASFGARLSDVSATPQRTRVRVCLPATAAVAEFLGRFTDAYPSADLVSKTSRRTTVHRNGTFADALTERQREVLSAAYEQGYFATPRERTGVEVAASLDISQPTFHQHIRAAQRNLFAALFEESLL